MNKIKCKRFEKIAYQINFYINLKKANTMN